MKVLLIKNIKFNQIHSRLGDRFLLKLADLCDLTIYGSNPDELKSNLSKKEFNKLKLVERRNEYTSKDIFDRAGKPDVILGHMFANFKALIPRDFSDVKIPKAVLLFDTYTFENGQASNNHKPRVMQENRVNLIIRRGCRTFYDHSYWKIPSVWLPFSVREENFYTDPETRYLYGRHNKLTFVGSAYESKNLLYKSVRNAINILKNEKLIEFQGRVGLDAYPNAIKSCVAALSYSFEHYKGHPAKLFELMGSGTGVVTTPFSNKKELFGDEDVCWEFNNNGGDVARIVKKVLDPNERKDLYRVTRNALRQINSKHLDKHRAVELYNILEALTSGSSIPQLWE